MTTAERTRIAVAATGGAAVVALATAVGGGFAEASADDEVTEAEVLDRSIAYFERKYQSDPYSYVLGARLADSYRLRFQAEADLSDLERAEEIARKVLRYSSDSAASYARLSTLALSRHDFTGAYRAARRAVEADPDDRGALATLFDAAMATGRSAVAESALSRMPGSSDAHRLRASRWQASVGQIRSAVRSHREVCRELAAGPTRDQVRAWCLTQQAGLELELRGPGAASERFEEALDVRPGYRGAIEGLADLAYADRRWKRAEELYRRILADAHPDLYLRMAEVLGARGDAEEAADFERRFVRIATVEGREALFARPLAYYYARSQETHDRALAVARGDLERRATAESYETLAWVHLRRGELDRALAMSDTARKLVDDPGSDSDYHRARVLLELERVSEATELLQRVKAAEPALLSHHVLRALRLEGPTG